MNNTISMAALIAMTSTGSGWAQSHYEVIAPGIVSQMDRYEFRLDYAPDGQSALYTYFERGRSYGIEQARLVDGDWVVTALPEFLEPFEGTGVLEPQYSPDGDILVFNSNRDTGNTERYDIWYVTRQGDAWSDAQKFGPAINSPAAEWYPTLVRNNRMYVGSERAGGLGGIDLYTIDNPFSADAVAVALPEPINSSAEDYDPYVDPDERFMIFISTRDGGFGRTDLYIALPDARGVWSTVHHIGAPFNDEGSVPGAPMLSADGNYLLVSGKVDGFDAVGDIIAWPLADLFAAAGLDYSDL